MSSLPPSREDVLRMADDDLRLVENALQRRAAVRTDPQEQARIGRVIGDAIACAVYGFPRQPSER